MSESRNREAFNRAQRAYDAQEPPEYWAEPLQSCPECGDGEMVPQVKRYEVSERNPQRYKCDNDDCGWQEEGA